MPNKPIKQDCKMWALCETGYLSNFMYISQVHGTAELQTHPDLTDTGSMVVQLNELLPKGAESPYTLYLENYFTSIGLFRLLRNGGIGACGTTLAKRMELSPQLQAFKAKFEDTSYPIDLMV